MRSLGLLQLQVDVSAEMRSGFLPPPLLRLCSGSGWFFFLITGGMTERSCSSARTVLQQCLQARLQVKAADEHSEAQFVQIDRGMVIYICFFKGAADDILPKMVSTLLNVRLCESSSGKMVSLLELPGSLLIVPQATLGGRAKGRTMQYHHNISKEDGLRLYRAFVSLCEQELKAALPSAAHAVEVTVKHGTYGDRQVLKLDTNGPSTHLMEF